MSSGPIFQDILRLLSVDQEAQIDPMIPIIAPNIGEEDTIGLILIRALIEQSTAQQVDSAAQQLPNITPQAQGSAPLAPPGHQ